MLPCCALCGSCIHVTSITRLDPMEVFRLCLGLHGLLLQMYLLLEFWQSWQASGNVLVGFQWSHLGFWFLWQVFWLCRSSGPLHLLGCLGKQPFVLTSLFSSHCCLGYVCLLDCWKQRSSESSAVALFVGFLTWDAFHAKLGWGLRIGGNAWFRWWP